ncbi:MAG: DUF559 domain-containing protein [Cyclobacteriaceae bacterium]
MLTRREFAHSLVFFKLRIILVRIPSEIQSSIIFYLGYSQFQRIARVIICTQLIPSWEGPGVGFNNLINFQSIRKIIPYRKNLVPLARKLRQQMTLSEVLLWQELKESNLGVRFSREIPIDNYIVDFYCKDLQLAIEIDGESHDHEDRVVKDRVRQKRLESLGVRFLRFDDLEVKQDVKWVVNEILEEVERLKHL